MNCCPFIRDITLPLYYVASLYVTLRYVTSRYVSFHYVHVYWNIIFGFWFHKIYGTKNQKPKWRNGLMQNFFLLCLLNFFFVDLLFTLLSDGRILKASTLTNPCKLLQEWDMKTNPDGKSRLPFTKSPRFLSLEEPFYSYKIQQ